MKRKGSPVIESDPLSGAPDRTPLYDEQQRLLLVFSATSDARSLLPWADGVWRPPSRPVAAAVGAALDAFSGWWISTSDPALAEGLICAGAQSRRRAHTLSHDLEKVPAIPVETSVRIERLTRAEVQRHRPRLGALAFAAYPLGHPDHAHDTAEQAAEEIAAIGSGDLLGPLMDQSRLARVGDDIVGACLLVDRPGHAPEGGPWVIELFRDPAAPVSGIGRALLLSVLMGACAARLPSVSLTVSHDNATALRLYHALGFVDTGQSWALAMPATPGGPETAGS